MRAGNSALKERRFCYFFRQKEVEERKGKPKF